MKEQNDKLKSKSHTWKIVLIFWNNFVENVVITIGISDIIDENCVQTTEKSLKSLEWRRQSQNIFFLCNRKS